MKTILTLLISLLFASTVFGASKYDVARWHRVVGVITALNVDNPVADISAGTFPWSAQSGRARVNLSTGAAYFEVGGLVVIGAPVSGTPRPVTAVTGTLVCNAGEDTEVVLHTDKVPLRGTG